MPFTKIVYYIKYLSIIFIFITSVFLIYNEYKNANEKIAMAIDSHHEDGLSLVNGYFKQFENSSIKFYSIFLNDEKIFEYILKKDKKGFDAIASEFYAKYLLSEPSLWGMDMILSDGSLFTHIHSSDNIFDFNYEEKFIA
ncbi:MAG: hypothetical protein JXQ66_01755 [Campylobacterales bacterium]|nr:hypothetical protein [Campylobacterales bacterium]